jgi:ABC-2 type transport system ATP-binding protein
VIETDRLTKTFGATEAVRDLTLRVEAGTIFGFLGPNGAGKTTTLRMLCGLLRPTSGTAVLDGIDVTTDPMGVKRIVGYLPDSPFLYDHLTLTEFLTFVGDVYGVPAARVIELGSRYLSIFELQDRAGERIAGFSLGMRKKAALAALLVREPRVLLLDEPTSGLDPRAVKTLRELLATLAGRGATILFSTHILEVAQKISHTIGIIARGRLVACGTMDELKAQATGANRDLEEIFLALTEEPKADAGEGTGAAGGNR